jgi:beta-galactosidase
VIRQSFDTGWSAGPALTAFARIGSSPDHPSVMLPHDVVRDLPRSAERGGGSHTGYFPGGYFEYVKTLDVPEAWREKTVLLEFEAVYRDAVVYVDDDFVAQRPNGYSGFAACLDPFLRFGQTVTIRVECRAHEDSRWYTGSGITRPTWLVVADPVHVPLDGVVVTTPDVDAERVVVAVATPVANVGRATRTVRVTTCVVDADGTKVAGTSAPVTLMPGRTEVSRARLRVAAPRLWNVDSPLLYSVETTVSDGNQVLDEDRTTFGIRTLQLDPEHGLRVNGATVDLRGACIHSDAGLLGAAAVPRADERRVELLKAAGFNAIRSAHNPLSRSTLDACDRVGLLVMDELTDVWTRAKSPHDYSLAFPEWWERDVEAFVAKDRNHPSVVLYSIGNEIFETGSPIGSSWGRRLSEKLRELDGTRYVTNALNPLASASSRLGNLLGDAEPNGADVNAHMTSLGEVMNRAASSGEVTEAIEESASVLDVLGLNYADSRYALDREMFPDRVLVGSETFPGRIAELWRLVREHPHVIGDFTWTGWDYLGEAGIGRVERLEEGADTPSLPGPYPWLTAWCGDIDITGHRRPASYYREIVFGLRTEPYLAVHRPERSGGSTWSTPWSWTDSVSSWSWDVPTGTPLTVDVYADAEAVELLLDGRSVGRVAVGEELPFLARLEVGFEPGELVAVASSGGTERGRTALRTARPELRLVATADRNEIRADSTDLAYVAVRLEDAEGTVSHDRDRPLTVEVTGAGVLAGLGSADPRTEEAFAGMSCTTFAGRALAIVRPTRPGEITLRVTTDGCDPVTVTVWAVEGRHPQP